MNRRLRSHRVPNLLLLGSLLMSGACQSPSGPKQAELVSEYMAMAKVVDVNAATRILTLQREDGRLVLLLAGDEVRNFDQIDVGDQLRVRYEESLTATRMSSLTEAGATIGGVAAAVAEKGEKPGAGIGVLMSMMVKIESLDPKNDIVVFSLDTSELIAHRVETPEGRAFVKGLKLGDVVQLDYAEGLAISVEEL